MADKNTRNWKRNRFVFRIVLTITLLLMQTYAAGNQASTTCLSVEKSFLCSGFWDNVSNECKDYGDACPENVSAITEKNISPRSDKVKLPWPVFNDSGVGDSIQKDLPPLKDNTITETIITSHVTKKVDYYHDSFDFFTVPSKPAFVTKKIKTIDEIIQDTGINIERQNVKEIRQPTLSSVDVIFAGGKYSHGLFIHNPSIDGEPITKAVHLEAKDDYTYTTTFEDTTLDIKFDTPGTNDGFHQFKVDNQNSWKIGYEFSLPSEMLTSRIRVSSSSPITVTDASIAEIQSGKIVLDFAAEKKNNYDLEIVQTSPRIVYIFLTKDFTSEGKSIGDKIIIDPTLTISGTMTQLCGEVNSYDKIEVVSSGILQICTRSGSGNSTGYANITLGYFGNFTLYSGSIIDGQGRGETGSSGCIASGCTADAGSNGNNGTTGKNGVGSNPNGGGGGGGKRVSTTDSAAGGGGGFGGDGGRGGLSANGTQGKGGIAYGAVNDLTLKMGSGGAGGATESANGTGGNGGAGLKIVAGAGGYILINGIVNLTGTNGTNSAAVADTSGGGGGSGGHAIYVAGTVDLSSSSTRADGGGGGRGNPGSADSCPGGGGGGGRIYVLYETLNGNGSFTTNHGFNGGNISSDAFCDNPADASGPSNGQNGTFLSNGTYFDRLPTITLLAPANITTNNTNNTPAFYFSVTDDLFAQPFLNCTLQANNATGNENFGTNNSVFNATKTIIVANHSMNLAPYTWWINCSDGNGFNWYENYFDRSNISETRNITINYPLPDLSVPIVTNLTPLQNSLFDITTFIEIGANVTDGSGISFVFANISYPNGSAIPFNLSNSAGRPNWYNMSFLIPVLTGKYNFTIMANDTLNNYNRTEFSNFTATDSTVPNVTTLLPTIDSNFEAGTFFQIAGNVTDEIGVSKVYANISYPNGSFILFELSLYAGTNKYNLSIDSLNSGKHNITIVANDTSNNYNKTERTNFTITDTIKPSFFTPLERLSDPATYSKNKNYYFNITVHDLIGIGNVSIYFNGTNYTTPFTKNSTTWEFNITDLGAGTYNYLWYANDTSQNLNQSDAYTYTVSQATGDLIFKLNDTAGDITFGYGGFVNASAVSANNTIALFRNNTAITSNNNLFETTTLAVGNYNYSAVSESNQNFTRVQINRLVTVTLQATIVNLTLNGADNDTTIEIGSSVNQTGYLLHGAEGNIQLWSNGTLMNNGTSPITNSTTYNTFGHFNITVTYQATQNYSSSQKSHLIIVTDTIKPSFFTPLERPSDPTTYAKNKNYFFNITLYDLMEIGNVSIYYNGINYTTPFTKNSTTFEFNITDLGAGTYNYLWYANDTSQNFNQSDAYTYTVSQATGDLLFKVNDTQGDITFGSKGQVNASAVSSNNTVQILKNGTDVTAQNNQFVSLGVGHYNYTGFALENQNFTFVRSQRIVIITDDIAPTFPRSFEQPTDPATYSKNQNYLFNATIYDNINVTYVHIEFNGINYTSLTHNFTDWQFSTSDLAVGTYNYLWYANDSLNNKNNSGTLTYTVTRATGDLLFKLNDSAGDITFGYGGKVNASAFSENNSVAVFQNNTAITNNIFGSILAVGNYNYSGVSESNQNFTRVQINRLVTVTSAGTEVNLSLNNQDNGVAIEAGSSVNITGYLLVGSQGNIQLWQNGTLLNNGTSPITNTTFHNSVGHFNISVTYQDTQNYSGSMENHTIIVTDALPPNVTTLTPSLNSLKEAGDYWEMGINVTDRVGVSKAFANIAYPNGSIILYELSNSGTVPQRYNISFTSLNLGLFQLNFSANDTSNNYNRTEFTNFTVIDTLKPNVTGLLPILNSNYNTGQTIEISVNVTDRAIISIVNATIYEAGGTITLLSLSNSTGFPYKFNNSYTIPASNGVYNVTFSANDTSNNINKTEFTNFTASTPTDTTPPNVTQSTPSLNSQQEAGNPIEVGINVSDGSGIVSRAFANISYPNGSTILFELSNSSGNFNRFNFTFSIPPLLGKYNISFIANDSYNNYNSTELTNFTAIDTLKPNVTGLLPSQNSQFETGQTIEISANVTDRTIISIVNATITRPGGITEVLTLSNSTGFPFKFNNSYTIPSTTGVYNISFSANDTSNNINNTEKTNFTAVDSESPRYFNLLEVPSDPATYASGTTYYFNATFLDNFAIGMVVMNFSRINYSITSNNGTDWQFTRTDLAAGTYNFIWYVNDTSNNRNETSSQSYTISKASPDLTFLLNDTAADIVFSYIGKVNSSARSTTSTIQILRNGTDITSQNNQFIQLAAGHYNHTGIAIENQNYSSSQINRLLIINRAPSEVNLTLNDTDAGITIELSSTINLTGRLITGETIIQLWRNGTLMNNGTSPVSNLSAFNSLGHFNITATYVESQNYSSSQENHTIIVIETVAPNVTGLLPPPNSEFTTGQAIEIAANVTDASSVSSVSATIFRPGGIVSEQITLLLAAGNKYNKSYTIPGTAGVYNITFFANDTFNNLNNTERTNFTASSPPDTTPPNVANATPALNSAFFLETSIEIGVNVTDDNSVSKVFANLTYPNGSIIPLELDLYAGTNKYNISFAIPNAVGTYSINFTANDTSNNYNRTERTNFSVSDNQAPKFSNLAERPGDPTTYAKNKNYFFNITINEPIGISNVSISFNYTNYTRPFTKNSTTWEFNITDLSVGTYEYIWYMNDSSNNKNVTTVQTYTVSPATGDLIFRLNDTPGDIIFGYGGRVNASAVSENNTVQVFRNGTDITTNNDLFETLAAGQYNYSGIALENQNFTATQISRLLTITKAPSAVNLTLNGIDGEITIELGSSINLTGYLITGEGAIQLWRNGTLLNNGSSPVSNLTAFNALGQFNITVTYYGTQNYSSSQENHTIIVTDTLPPNVTTLTPTLNSQFNTGAAIEIAANVSDATAVSKIIANVTYPNSSSILYELNNATTNPFGTKFNISLSLSSQAGKYSIYFIANDTQSNYNRTEFTNFTAVDNTPPPGVSNVANQTVSTNSIYWNWTNPAEVDFYQAILYLNNSNIANTSDNFYTASGLNSDTDYNLTINTKDVNGNTNYTNISDIARTKAVLSGGGGEQGGGSGGGGGSSKTTSPANVTNVTGSLPPIEISIPPAKAPLTEVPSFNASVQFVIENITDNNLRVRFFITASPELSILNTIYNIIGSDGRVILEETETLAAEHYRETVKNFILRDVKPGNYILKVKITHEQLLPQERTAEQVFTIGKSSSDNVITGASFAGEVTKINRITLSLFLIVLIITYIAVRHLRRRYSLEKKRKDHSKKVPPNDKREANIAQHENSSKKRTAPVKIYKRWILLMGIILFMAAIIFQKYPTMTGADITMLWKGIEEGLELSRKTTTPHDLITSLSLSVLLCGIFMVIIAHQQYKIRQKFIKKAKKDQRWHFGQ